MAKQIGIIRITGTFNRICFYCMDGIYYAREKSSLTKERVKRDPAFSETMRYARRMGDASKLASVIYRNTVPVQERSRERYRELVGMVIKEMDAALRCQGLNHGDTKAQRNTNKKILACNGESAAAQDEMNHRDTKTRRRKRGLLTDCAEIHRGLPDFYFMRHEFHGLRRIKRRRMATKDQGLR